ncbi:hypothetical protein [Azospirillum halopraeferens]|uniref:hypothetical protein n=1 Tax=Azospirillum halopraeferens TaxID=34010 RepID=UPI000427D570|nr:hypothetical protein [Azospirillum halopraeferens]
MASIIIALFDCPDEASRVAGGLVDAGVPRDEVFVAGGDPPPERAELEDLAQTLGKLGVPEADAANYADGIAAGGALLVVRAAEGEDARVRGLIARIAHGGVPSAAEPDGGGTACDTTDVGQAAGAYGTRGAATAFGGIERVPARSPSPEDVKH